MIVFGSSFGCVGWGWAAEMAKLPYEIRVLTKA
jgi:hypothetical protein